VDHLAFFEGNSHGDKTRLGNLEFANILIKTRKILELHVGDVGTKVKLSGDVNTAIKSFEGGPNVAGGCCFSRRDNRGDDRGDTAFNDVLDFRILLPPLPIGLEDGGTRIGGDSRHGNFREGGERVVRAFDEAPETFTLQSPHDGFAPCRVVGSTIKDRNVVEFEGHGEEYMRRKMKEDVNWAKTSETVRKRQ